jgi:serine/threonine-protein kinase SRPK3
LKEFIEEIDENHDSEDEGIEDYKLGGYHPVHIGEVLINRYVVIQKLGWGHFSTVWLCRDFKFGTYVAVKIQKSAPHYMEAAFDEVEILQKLSKHYEDRNWQGK